MQESGNKHPDAVQSEPQSNRFRLSWPAFLVGAAALVLSSIVPQVINAGSIHSWSEVMQGKSGGSAVPAFRTIFVVLIGLGIAKWIRALMPKRKTPRTGNAAFITVVAAFGVLPALASGFIAPTKPRAPMGIYQAEAVYERALERMDEQARLLVSVPPEQRHASALLGPFLEVLRRADLPTGSYEEREVSVLIAVLEPLNEQFSHFEATAGRWHSAGGLDAAAHESPDSLARIQLIARDAAASSDQLGDMLGTIAKDYFKRLRERRVKHERARILALRLAELFPPSMITQYRNGAETWRTGESVAELLEEHWDSWEYDPLSGSVVFYDPNISDRYDELAVELGVVDLDFEH